MAYPGSTSGDGGRLELASSPFAGASICLEKYVTSKKLQWEVVNEKGRTLHWA